MPTIIVPKVRTALDDETAVQALDDAYLAVTAKRPSPAVLALMAAQTDVETGSYQEMYCNNWGGNKAMTGFPMVFQSQTKEMGPDGKTLVVVKPPDARCNFQAFASPAEGAREYVKRLMRRPSWWNGLHTESVEGFVDGLHTPSYFTADPEVYKEAMRKRLARLLPLFEARIAVGWVPPASLTSRPPPPPNGNVA